MRPFDLGSKPAAYCARSASPESGPSPPASLPRSIYIRCKNSVQEALYSQMMSVYFKVCVWG